MPAAGLIEELIVKEEIKYFVARKRMISADVNKLFALIWGKFTDALQLLIRLHEKYEQKA